MAGLGEERRLIADGCRLIAGVDEVGRGCWAGPVVAAAVIFPPAILEQPELLRGIEDSKTLSASQRDAMAARIGELALGVGVGAAPAFVIDHFGIGPATAWAMAQAVLALPLLPDALLIDWVRLPALPIRQRSMPRGDALSVSIAAASIIAKVRRDRMLAAWDRADGRYGFGAHKGYGTAQHQAALARFGPSALHRRSFRPVAALGDWGSGTGDR
ncbi:MAG TPA: ribonuclease HII, partial [Herpetosiphonaceae bacterium]